MSVVVWDGKTIAADRRQCCGALRSETSKMCKLPNGEVLAWTGTQERGLALADWYRDGASPAKWPSFQSDDDWVRLIVASCEGAFFYEQLPIRQMVIDPFGAWGEGRDFAYGALGMGATARQAVEVTARFCVSVGDGIEAYDLAAATAEPEPAADAEPLPEPTSAAYICKTCRTVLQGAREERCRDGCKVPIYLHDGEPRSVGLGGSWELLA